MWTHGAVVHQDDNQFVLFAARASIVLVILLTLPVSIQSPQLLGCTVLFIILAWFYSSPPLRLKERPILDSLSNGVCCWLLWVCGYTSTGHIFQMYHAGGNFSCGGFVLLFFSASHCLGAIADRKADASAKQRTIATVFGEKLSVLFAVVCL